MNNKIAQQVAALTPEQQYHVWTIGKKALLWMIIGGVPILLFTVLGMVFAFTDPSFFASTSVFYGYLFFLCLGGLYFVAVFLVTKLLCPEYSDSKWRYINKMYKNQQ